MQAAELHLHTWDSLLDDLRNLPVDSRWRNEWVELLDVMELDGDFAPRPAQGSDGHAPRPPKRP